MMKTDALRSAERQRLAAKSPAKSANKLQSQHSRVMSLINNRRILDLSSINCLNEHTKTKELNVREQMKKKIKKMLQTTQNEMKVNRDTDVISGPRNLLNGEKLNNEGYVKKMLKDFVKQNEVLKSQINEVKHDKRIFVPFVDERDQLGRLIQNEFVDYQQFPRSYIKKKLIFRPRKVHDKIEFSNEMPRRWKQGESPLKNQQYYNRKRSQELSALRDSFPFDVSFESFISIQTISRNMGESALLNPESVDENKDEVKIFVADKSKVISQRKIKLINSSAVFSPASRKSFGQSRSRLQSANQQFQRTMLKNNILDGKYNSSVTSPHFQGEDTNTNQSTMARTFDFSASKHPILTQDESLKKSHYLNDSETLVRPFSMSQQRTKQNRPKNLSRQLFGSVSPRHGNTQVQSQLRFDTTPLVDMMNQSIRTKYGGTSSFKSTQRRRGSKSKPNLSLREQIQMKPSVGFYEPQPESTLPKPRNLNHSIEKQIGRKEIQPKDFYLPFKSLLNSFDYSSFKECKNVIDIQKVQSRDDVSFLKNLAKYQMACTLGMDMMEFDQLWKQDKQGVYERILMLRKS